MPTLRGLSILYSSSCNPARWTPQQASFNVSFLFVANVCDLEFDTKVVTCNDQLRRHPAADFIQFRLWKRWTGWVQMRQQ